MDEAAYRAKLAAEGYAEPVLVEIPPNTFVDTHVHDFSSCIFLLAGEITVETAEKTTTCGPGDVRAQRRDVPHKEWTGPEGAKLWSGRKSD